MDEGLYIGLMSGTSMDGIDAVLVKIDPQSTSLIHAINTPYDDSVLSALTTCIDNHSLSWKAIGSINNLIGEHFALSTLELLKQAQVDPKEIRAIGSHGHTVHHSPDSNSPFTLQWGNPSIIACSTKIAVVSHFRDIDVALGGQGAPLAPRFHQHAFQNTEVERMVVNIGGIANITQLPTDDQSNILGMDTGPGNGLMNSWVQKHTGKAYDDGGQWARSGDINGDLLERLLADPYLAQPAPKSTGREHFNLDWLYRSDPELDAMAPEDVQATLCQYTAETIANHIKEYAKTPNPEVIICGGGAHNTYLMERLSTALAPISVEPSSTYGIDPDWVEATAFAWFAWAFENKIPGNLPSVTGAKSTAVLGRLQLPPNE